MTDILPKFLSDAFISKQFQYLLCKLSAPAEDSTPFANSPAVAQASPIDNQDEKQVNAGEEANKAMEKTEAELGNKVRMIKSLY